MLNIELKIYIYLNSCKFSDNGARQWGQQKLLKVRCVMLEQFVRSCGYNSTKTNLCYWDKYK